MNFILFCLAAQLRLFVVPFKNYLIYVNIVHMNTTVSIYANVKWCENVHLVLHKLMLSRNINGIVEILIV